MNTLPLIHYLKEKPTLAPPARLAELLTSGEIDIATTPIVTLFENPTYTLIPGVCIGSKGPVESVKLFYTSPEVTIENVRSIYLDSESKTSVALLKILLKYYFKRNLNDITFHRQLPSQGVDAKLLIGDKALVENPIKTPLDLGEAWTQWTNLPFVFAAWISRNTKVGLQIIEELNAARDEGVKNLPSVIPSATTIPSSLVLSYLKNLNYTLGDKEMEAIQLFKTYFEKYAADL